jgi:hypothetical protein
VGAVIQIYIFGAIALVAAGAVLGALAVVSLGIRRDDHRGGFPADTGDWKARAARRLTGAGARGAVLKGVPGAARHSVPV